MDKLPPLALPAVSSGRSVEIPHLYARTISRLEENQKSLPENQLKANLIEINETIEKAEWLLSHDHFEKADRELRTQLKKILYDPITYYKIVEERNFFLKTKHGGKLFLAFVKCYVLLGTACVRRKRFDDATVFFEKATAQCGTVKDKRVWSMLYTIEHETVKMLLMQGKQRESIEHLRLSQKYYALMTGDEEWLGRIKYTTDNELLKLVHGTAVTDNRINSRKKDSKLIT
jgi:hypothetical protein